MLGASERAANGSRAGVRLGQAALALLLGLTVSSLAAAPPASGAMPAPAVTPCTLVFGQGRNPSADAPEVNTQWDDINRAFASQVALEIAERDIRTVLVLASVTMTDLPRLVRELTDNARREGCNRIVETTLFAQDDDLLVARLREYPLAGSGESLRIGEPRYSNRQEYPNTQRNRDRLVPASLGKRFADEYLRARAP